MNDVLKVDLDKQTVSARKLSFSQKWDKHRSMAAVFYK